MVHFSAEYFFKYWNNFNICIWYFLSPTFRALKIRKLLFKKWANPGLFFIYLSLFKHKFQFLQQINVKMSILYTVRGFELMTFGT